jgi:valyl-tRNA synthetase
LGNSPDPLDLITKYSADGVRVGMLLCSPAGNDLPFDDSMCEQGRNFSNKIWNAFRLIQGFDVDDSLEQPEVSKIAIEWFDAKFNQQLAEINDLYTKFRLSDALMATYKLVWDDFCAWYLEMIKPEFADGKAKPVDAKTVAATIGFFENILKILHPFMPFITEELYHNIAERSFGDACIVAKWPEPKNYSSLFLEKFGIAIDVVAQVRNIRNQKNIHPKEMVELLVRSSSPDNSFDSVIRKLAGVSSVKYTSEKPASAAGFILKSNEYFVPIQVNVEEEKARLEKELIYNQGFLQAVQKKLANEKFVSNAKPELIEHERRKQFDAEAKIKAIEQQLGNL